MGLQYRDLNQATRDLMVEEIELDIEGNGLYFSNYLNDYGTAQWGALTLQAARSGSDDTLAMALSNDCMKSMVSRRTPKGGATMVKVPYTAPQTLAEAQFNMYYICAVARRALTENKILVVYRAKAVDRPRPESQAMIGRSLDAQFVLDELRRTKGVDPATDVPLPNSGITVTLA